MAQYIAIAIAASVVLGGLCSIGLGGFSSLGGLGSNERVSV